MIDQKQAQLEVTFTGLKPKCPPARTDFLTRAGRLYSQRSSSSDFNRLIKKLSPLGGIEAFKGGFLQKPCTARHSAPSMMGSMALQRGRVLRLTDGYITLFTRPDKKPTSKKEIEGGLVNIQGFSP